MRLCFQSLKEYLYAEALEIVFSVLKIFMDRYWRSDLTPVCDEYSKSYGAFDMVPVEDTVRLTWSRLCIWTRSRYGNECDMV